MEFEVGDIVEITNQPKNKWGTVVEIPTLPVFGAGSVKIRFLDDGSTLYMNVYLLRKWPIKELIGTRCPVCTSLWHKSTGFKEDFYDCKNCNEKKEVIIKKFHDKIK